MKEIQEIVKTVAQFAHGEKAILATVVDVQGSSYRRAGARMLIDANGNSIGTVSGGCLEADVLERAKKILASGEPQVITYDTTKDENSVFGLGMGCRGVVRVLLEAVDNESPIIRNFTISVKQRRRQALATLIATTGNLFVGGRSGYDEIEQFTFQNLATELENNLALQQDCKNAFIHNEKSFCKTYQAGNGEAEFFIEVIEPPLSLLLFGAGHDAIPVVNLAHQLGWHITVIDHRAAWVTGERFPDADRIFPERIENINENIFQDQNSVAVIMTHSYERDGEILRRLLHSSCRYIGALGPKSRTEKLLSEIGERFNEESLTRLHAPVGLDIGADTPESIALSIIAEIQSVLAGRDAGFLRNRRGPIYGR